MICARPHFERNEAQRLGKMLGYELLFRDLIPGAWLRCDEIVTFLNAVDFHSMEEEGRTEEEGVGREAHLR